MATNKPRRGRPLKPTTQGRKSQVGLMLTAEMKSRIADEAVRTGRSMGETAEQRLLVSYAKSDLMSEVMELAFGGRQAAGLLRLLGRALSILHMNKLPSTVDWLDHAANFHAAVAAIAHVLDELQPPGDIAQRDDVENLGQGAAKAALAILKETRSPEAQSIADELGSLFIRLKEKAR